MRTRTALALSLMFLLAGCAAATDTNGVATAAGTPTATVSAAATASGDAKDRDAPIRFAQCMREHGMTWFPDPQPDSHQIQIKVPPGQDKAKVDAAMKACQKFLPNGGPGGKADPQMIEQGRRMAKCMREHGLPDFPDPQPNGSVQLDRGKLGAGPGDPKFDAAEKACARYMPSDAKRETAAG
jgi:hypothetical protein